MWCGLASITFANDAWKWAALAAAVVLVPLAVLAARPARTQRRTLFVALALRTLGIGLLLLCLLDPQWTTPRAKPGANFLAILVDNSASLQITDAKDSASRGEKVRDTLTGVDSHWLASLAEEYQLRPYVFDRDLRRVQDYTQLDFQGESTALGAALRGVRDRFAGQPLAGILLFTDGDATDLPKGLTDLDGLPPVYPVVVGNADGLQDISVSHLDVHQTAFDDAPVSLHAEISGQNAGNRNVAVTVRALNAPPLKSGEADTSAPPPQTLHLNLDSQPVDATFDWHPRGSGVQFFEVTANATGSPPLPEATMLNNNGYVMVDRGRPAYRILCVEGWFNPEFKYLNRALDDDTQLQLVGLIRVAKREPKFEFIDRNSDPGNPLFGGFANPDDTQTYDQPVLKVVNARDETELSGGFPRTAAELYQYDAVIIDHLEASFFSADQLALLRRFVAERGGGLLFLGGADTMEDGGYANTLLANAMPVYLDRKAPVPQGDLTFNLTREGWLEPWTRVRATEDDEKGSIEDMPHFQVSNAISAIKPGATVLATVTDQVNHVYPALVAQNYGAGRVACLTIGDLWKWGLTGDKEMADLSHFWRQLSRWLVTNVPAPVELKVEQSTSAADAMTLRVTAYDPEYRPLDLGVAHVKITRVGAKAAADSPGFEQVTLPAEPVMDAPGQFTATFTPHESGSYLAEADVVDKTGKVIGRAQAGWVNDPSLEEFQSLAPNKALLEELARRTGGKVIDWSQLNTLPAMLPTQHAPITEDSSHPLWQDSGVFLAVLLCFLAEWGWRRWKGLP
jgi:uncharacterized membrane protein